MRALSRACDSYVRKMSACAGHMPAQYAGAVGRGGFGGPGSMNAAAFSSRSTRRGDDAEVAELVRAMSQRSAARASPDTAAAALPVRSRSVAVGRIDEDAPVEFGADAGRVGLPPPAVRRSRSVAVGGFPPRSGGFGAAAATKKAPGGGGGAAAAVVVHGG